MPLLIGDAIRDAARATPQATAATLGADQISFAALDEQANRAANALRGLGVRRGDVLAWWSGAALHNLTGMLACARIGAVFAPLSPQLGPGEARPVLDYLDPRLLVCDDERLEPGSGVRAVGVDGLDSLIRSASPAAPVTPDLTEDDPHILYLTSGSTGTPKGVLVSHRASWLRSAPGPADPPMRGMLSSFPLFHYGGWHYVLEAWLNRTAVHLVPKADAAHLIDAIQRHRPTAMYAIPAVWERVLAEPADLSSLRNADTGTSLVAEELLERLAARIPRARTRILYGASEAGRMTSLAHHELAGHPGSVGTPFGAGQIRIAEDGEVLFRGPTLMNGYLRLADQPVHDGWYRTGDLGRLDERGFLYLTGRKREVIRSGGETISPAEVETAIRGLPGVRDVAVVGLPDSTWGEVVCAAIVPEDGQPMPTVASLRAQLPGLASYKHPRVIAAAAEIPRTSATGQVVRAKVRANVLAEQAASHA
ncbi:class I adenylate-forming enzyme family protein [Saccharopolyspora sp. NPDC002686]|uniref:class I adenylate-forming enzyme family protein n=1 Tax=Saccharopolyspora sp. NPDC002686 TaxID=3154541 RepID=UPI00331AEF7F